MEKLLVLDGNSLINRAFFALPPMSNSKGAYTNAVVGFFTMFFKMKEEFDPDYITVAFDMAKKTFRNEKYSEYKSGRKGMPDELREQFPIIKDILKLMDINIYGIEGFEADDVIGTISKKCEEEHIECYIITGDRDALQLASKTTKVVLTKKGISETEIYDYERMVSDYEVTPTEFIDVKGLMGDSSDNIPGVPGVGEKTAYKLIREYKTIEKVLDSTNEIKGKKLVENLITYREQAILSKELATIIREVPIDIDMEEIKSNENYDIDKLRTYFMELEMKGMLSKLPKNVLDKKEIKFDRIYEKQKIIEFINIIEGEIFLDSEFIIENILNIKLKNITILYKDRITVLEFDENMDENICKLLSKDSVNIITCDSKILMEYLISRGYKKNNIVFDIALSSYIVESSRKENNIVELVQKYFYEEIENINYVRISYYSKIYKILKEKINQANMEKLLYEIELPLTNAIGVMELNGFRVNINELQLLGEKFVGKINKLTDEIYELSGEEFNISSPKQLGVILFEKLNLPVIKKTKTGYSTNAEVLEELGDKHDIISKIGEYRHVSKLYSTYIEGLKPLILKDGKIHSKFNQLITTTGRLSSTEPNLQNIPIKDEMGREIRKAFVAEENSILLSADYSQIELRVMAHMAGEQNLINAFKEGIDIHTKTASEVFNVEIKDVTSTMRGRAKAVNFGIIYGIGAFSLSKDLKILRSTANEYIEAYFASNPNVKSYLDKTIEECMQKGFVSTITNRRRYISEINSSNKMTKNLGIRLAMNAPVQGSAADIIKIAMVNIQKELYKRKLKSTLILQVHDELILNVNKDEELEVEQLVKLHMETAVMLDVPLVVDINKGETWYETK